MTFPTTFYGSHMATSLKNGLIACWEMDDTSGTVLTDEVDSDNDLDAINGALLNQTGHINKCVDLDGSNDYLEHYADDDRFTPAAAHSVSFWFKREADNGGAGSQAYIVSKFLNSTGSRVYQAGILDSDFGSGVSNRLAFSYYDSSNNGQLCSYVAGSDIYTGNWMHVVTVRNGSSMTLYLNNSSVATASGANGSGKQNPSGTVPFLIGARGQATPDYHFNGKIDQVAVWDKALTSTEVATLYNSGSGLAYTGW